MNNEITRKLLEYMNSTESFLYSEVPDVINQMINYEFWSSLMLALVSSVIFIYLVVTTKKLFRLWVAENYDFPVFIATGALAIPSLFIALCNIDLVCMTYFSPKYFIIKHLSKMIVG